MPTRARMYEAITDLASLWGSDNPAFRQVFTSRFIPEGTDEQMRWFNELCQKTIAPELAPVLMRARGETDVTALLSQVKTPTLVLHGRNDAIAPLSEGRFLASEIPGAQFVELDSRNHVLLAHEAAWDRFREAVLAFTGQREPVEAPAFATLSKRERETLMLLAEGLEQLGDCRAARHQREDRAQPPVPSVRQAWCLVPRASHRVRPRSRFHGLRRVVNLCLGNLIEVGVSRG